MSDLLPVPDPAPLPIPRVSVSPLSSPTSVGLAIETWLRSALLRLSLSPVGSGFRLRIGTRQASVHVVLQNNLDGIRIELPEPFDAARKAAWLRLLSSFDTYCAEGVTAFGRPFGMASVQQHGFDPKRDKDWILAALRALDIDWVDLHGDGIGWA